MAMAISIDAVELDDAHVDPLAASGGQVLADVLRADRQLAMAAVDENRELDPGRAAVVEQGIDRRSDRAPREQDVVHDDHGPPVDREVEVRRVDHGASGRVATSSR